MYFSIIIIIMTNRKVNCSLLTSGRYNRYPDIFPKDIPTHFPLPDSSFPLPFTWCRTFLLLLLLLLLLSANLQLQQYKAIYR